MPDYALFALSICGLKSQEPESLPVEIVRYKESWGWVVSGAYGFRLPGPKNFEFVLWGVGNGLEC